MNRPRQKHDAVPGNRCTTRSWPTREPLTVLPRFSAEESFIYAFAVPYYREWGGEWEGGGWGHEKEVVDGLSDCEGPNMKQQASVCKVKCSR